MNLFRRQDPPPVTAADFKDDQGNTLPTCTHCGGWHDIACPRVKRIVFGAGEGIRSVEYWPWGEWPKDRVTFPGDLEDVTG